MFVTVSGVSRFELTRVGSARRNGFHKDRVGQSLADTEPGIADQANEIGVARQEFDPLLLTKAEFPEAIGQFGGSCQPLDANHRPGLNPAQRADLGSSALPFKNHESFWRWSFQLRTS